MGDLSGIKGICCQCLSVRQPISLGCISVASVSKACVREKEKIVWVSCNTHSTSGDYLCFLLFVNGF